MLVVRQRYGRSLPTRFFELAPGDCAAADVMLVVGTSLTVHPASSLPSRLRPGSAKVLVNRDAVGGFDVGGGGGGGGGVEDDGGSGGGGDGREEGERAAAPRRGGSVHLAGDADDVFLLLAAELGWMDELSQCVSRGDGGSIRCTGPLWIQFGRCHSVVT